MQHAAHGRPTLPSPQHLPRSIFWKGRHRCAASHGLQHDQPKGFRAAWKHKDIGRGIHLCQRIPVQDAKPPHLWVLGFQPCFERAHTTHDLGAWHVQLQKGVNVLFIRDTAHIQRHRMGQDARERALANLAMESERLGIHTMRPQAQVAEAPLLQHLQDPLCGHHDP